jgi:hypothetical protein
LVGDPEVAHFHGAVTLALDSVVGNAGSGGIVAMNWRWWLRVTQNKVNYSTFFGMR